MWDQNKQVIVLGALISLAVVSALGVWLLSGDEAAYGDLGSADVAARRNAAKNLTAGGGEKSVAAISSRIRDRDEDEVVKLGLIRKITATRKKAYLPALRDAMTDKNAKVRAKAVRAAKEIIEADPPSQKDTIPALMARLGDPQEDPKVRAEAARCLGELRYWEAMDLLLIAAADRDVYVRGGASKAFRHIFGAIDMGYRAQASPAERDAAIRKIQAHWRGFYQRYQQEQERRKRNAS